MPPTQPMCSGVLSLILWSLLLIISVKYLILILRADNRGEGGILALATLVGEVVRRGKFLFLLGLFGAALALRRRDDHAGDLGPERGRGIACRHPAVRSLCRPDCGRDSDRIVLLSITWHDRSGQGIRPGHNIVVSRDQRSRDSPDSSCARKCSPRSIRGMAFDFFLNNGGRGFVVLGRGLSRRHRRRSALRGHRSFWHRADSSDLVRDRPAGAGPELLRSGRALC